MALPSDVLNIWGGGQLLAYSGIEGTTDFYEGLTLRTCFDCTGIDAKLPGDCRIWVSDETPRGLHLSGDYFEIRAGAGVVRGAILDAYHILIDGPCEIRGCSDKIAHTAQGNRTLVGSASHFNPALVTSDLDEALRVRRGWLERLPAPVGVSATRRRSLYKCYSQIKTQVYTAEGLMRHRFTTPDRWPHRKMWLWDSAFHAIGIRHLDPDLARDAVEAVLDAQREDGFVSISAEPRGRSEKYTQPPVLALAAELVNRTEPDRAWIARIFPKLEAYVTWDLANRDTDGAGLVEWAIEGNVNCRSGESGLDNSPRFNEATQLDATDFNSMLALECEVLARFAGILDKADRAAHWQATRNRLCTLINERLWNPTIGFYVDYDVSRNKQSAAIASTGFLPLICGACAEEQVDRLEALLADPAMFATALPVASIAASDTEHYSKDMWRGPVWVNINWLIARGFDRYGRHETARALRERTCAEIEKHYLKYGTMFEFFDDRCEVDPPQLLRKGACNPEKSPYHQVFHDYGWTATLYVDMVQVR